MHIRPIHESNCDLFAFVPNFESSSSAARLQADVSVLPQESRSGERTMPRPTGEDIADAGRAA